MTQKTCVDCAECMKKGGVLCCHEMWDKPIVELTECPLGIEEQEVDKANEAEKVKIRHGARADKPKTKRTVERKPDLEKIEFINYLAETLSANYENVTITNKSKVIEFTINGKWYKIDFSYQRNKNKTLKGE